MNPPFNEPITDQMQRVARGWIAWFNAASGGGKVLTPTVGASPFTYHNTSPVRQQVIVSGGTVSAIQVSRDNTTFYTVTANAAVLFPGDYMKVTYTVAPTMVAMPI